MTPEPLNDRVVQLARSPEVTRGRKIRVDPTAVETDIHFPTDSDLHGDGVRVVSRCLRRGEAEMDDAVKLGWESFRRQVRTVWTLARQRHRIARREEAENREALKHTSGR